MGRRKMVETSSKYCKQCEYSWGHQDSHGFVYCDYLCRTGKRRNCPVGKCDKFKQRETNRKGIPWSDLSNLFQKMKCEKPTSQTKTLETM